ncbi:MAG: glutathione S-transferase [Rhodobacteraceae bacterium]|jgi:glutathione S-transferase|nr:glutathione S-transferase [Paracoccaceae bacterium]|tara:strand:- start:1095 stop:1730 length:636 start_codon:yes stop_codon:yes gene_type:complete
MSENRILWGVGTSRTIRAHWALIELNLSYKTEIIRTRTTDTETAAFKSVNPRQKIPVLQDGTLTMGESAAIVTYLAESYSTEQVNLIPDNPKARAKYFEWMSFICMELDATSLYVLRRHWSLPEIYGDSPIANKASEEYFNRMITAADKLKNPKQKYLLETGFSGVDILMTTTLKWAIDYNQKIPNDFMEYLDHMVNRPGYIAALEANKMP